MPHRLIREGTVDYELSDALLNISWDKVIISVLRGANVDRIEAPNGSPLALHYSIQNNRLDVADTLIKLGANINAKSRNNMSPMHYAVQSLSLDAVDLVINAGGNLNHRDNIGNTPLHYVALHYNLLQRSDDHSRSILARLLEAGADPNAKNEYGTTPLHLAIRMKNHNCAKLLISYGANPAVKDNEGISAQKLAEVSKNHAMIRILSRQNARLR